ncbi:MAG: DUF4062 domain-containing protein [Cellulomonas sp.]|nr:DUF4062 domain-containing protein [Cellulomonas sp.]
MTGSAEARHQVFVSSTYVDLIEERRTVIQALLELDCIPAGMELFPAADADQWTLIREVIDLSDYYVVIVGGRYGSVSASGISFTEMEYDYAVSKGIPVLGFVHGDPDSIPAGRSEMDPEARANLDDFRLKVMQRMVKQFTSPDELASVVSRGLVRAMKTQPRPGWVRGDQAMTDTMRAEVAELRAALAEKERAELADRADQVVIDESFAHGDDRVDLTFSVSQMLYNDVPQSVEREYSWDQIVSILGPFMIDEAPEPSLRNVLCQHSAGQLSADAGAWGELTHPSVKIVDSSWGTVLVQLRALGIITTGTKKRTVSDSSVYWKLTPAGDNYLVRLKAQKRTH